MILKYEKEEQSYDNDKEAYLNFHICTKKNTFYDLVETVLEITRENPEVIFDHLHIAKDVNFNFTLEGHRKLSKEEICANKQKVIDDEKELEDTRIEMAADLLKEKGYKVTK